jgi:transcription-repair coupling factor (superfamily II helicase)
VIHLRRNLEAALDGGTLAELRARLRAGAPVVAVGGATGGARALTLAAAVLAGDRPYAVVTPSGREAEQLAHELDFLLSLLAPEAPPVVHLPEREVDPYRGLSMHPDVAAARAQALWRLGQDGTRVLVASIRAAAVRLPSPAQFRAWCLELRQGDEIGPDAVRDRLVETGYVEDDPVTEPGEFSIRGGIIDLFSPQADEAARLEFFGDRLESIRVFDPETQRSVRQLDAVEIIPMRELCPSRPALRRWAVEATRRWQPPFDRDLEEELAQASRGELFAGFEFLLPAVERLDHTLFDYLAGFRLARVDAEVASSALARHHADLYERFVDRVEAHKAVASPEEIYLGTEEVEARMARMPRLEVEELAIDAAGAAPPLFLACQTARKYHGNVREAMADLAAFRQAGDTVVLVMTNLGCAAPSPAVSPHRGRSRSRSGPCTTGSTCRPPACGC